ncbi:MAG: hypothetical protein ACRC9X_06835, partial [Bacteroidales bacterium]
VQRLAPVFAKAVQIIAEKYPHLHLILPTIKVLTKQVEKHFIGLNIPYTIIEGTERYSAFSASHFALAASGTVSLELAICETPHLIAYTFNRLTNALAKLLVKNKTANLINILAQKEIIPEFTLEKCKAHLIAEKALSLLGDKVYQQTQIQAAKRELAKLQVDEHTLPSETAARFVWETLSKYRA